MKPAVPNFGAWLWFLCFLFSGEKNSASNKSCGLCGQPSLALLRMPRIMWISPLTDPWTGRAIGGELRAGEKHPPVIHSYPHDCPQVWVDSYPGWRWAKRVDAPLKLMTDVGVSRETVPACRADAVMVLLGNRPDGVFKTSSGVSTVHDLAPLLITLRRGCRQLGSPW